MRARAIVVRPVVVTLAVHDETQRRWDALRRRHFPAHRLLVGAHLTLFHAIPGEHGDAALAAAGLARETVDAIFGTIAPPTSSRPGRPSPRRSARLSPPPCPA